MNVFFNIACFVIIAVWAVLVIYALCIVYQIRKQLFRKENRGMLESGLEQRMKTEVEAKGGMFLKWTSPGFTGVPDRIALLPGGRILFVEVKRPGVTDGRTPRQKRVAFQLQELGFNVIRAASLEELRDAL